MVRAPRGRILRGGALVFLTALVLRLLFWRATPDAGWPSSAAYQGDAFTWLASARALLEGGGPEAGLPWRPPGMTWLLAALGAGRGTDVVTLKLVWCLLGALVALLVYRAVRRDFGDGPALATGLLCAASTGLMVLSTSLNNETPWLLLALLALSWTEPLRRRPTPWLAAAWGAVNAAACLVRAEHLLFVGLGLAWIAVGRGRSPHEGSGGLGALRPFGFAALAFVAVLAPWHVLAWGRVTELNDSATPLAPREEARHAALERTLAFVRWDPEAEAALERLPAVSRRRAAIFVAATVAHRGRTRVRGEDLGILEDAFGAMPAPLPERFFVALYGGLNFYLANNARAEAGFARGPLDAPPPLAGGAHRYPAPLVAGLPPPELALAYPPHGVAVAHGYRLGWEWIASHPGEAGRRAWRKLRIFWAGATLGWTGYNLPTGLSGLRRGVDLVVPEGFWGATLWPLLVLVGCGAGLVAGRREPTLVPWLLYLGSRAAAAVLFFGYARFGATAVPVVALLLTLAARAAGRRVRGLTDKTVAGRARRSRAPNSGWRRAPAAAAVVASLLVVVEATRWARSPVLLLEGRPAGASDPFADDYRDVHLEVRG